MSSKGTKRAAPAEERPAREPSRRIDEGLGVFKALVAVLLFYVSLGIVVWFAWNVWRHWYVP